MTIECKSRIERVTVYAEGAQVTRSIALPEALAASAAGGLVDLALSGLSPLSEAGSFGASAEGGSWRVLSVKATLTTPAAQVRPGEPEGAVRRLEEARQRLEAEREQRLGERALVLSTSLGPRLRPGKGAGGIEPRVEGALARSALLDRLAREADERLLAIDEALEANARALDAERLRAAQATGDERRGEGQRSRRVALRIGGEGRLERLELHYVVPAARWWPVYTLRMREGGDRAELSLEALVAQLSGEDWADVTLLLASADRIRSARLPELASLRLGRAQPRPRSGFRPPPPGLGELFAGYDRAFPPAAPAFGPPPPPSGALGRAGMADKASERVTGWDEGGLAQQEEETTKPMKKDAPAPGMPASSSSFVGANRSESGALPPMPAQMNMPQASPVAMKARRVSMGEIAASAAVSRAPGFAGMAGGHGGAMPHEEDTRSIEPADAWSDLGALELGPSTNRGARGRLRRVPADDAAAGERALGRLLAAEPPGRVCDVSSSRGHFAHRYQAEGQSSVPSDGLPHRVSVGTREGRPRVIFRTVPRETPEVFREALLDNPFPSPLLAGPVDVYLDGSLVTVASMERVGRGGPIRVGLGVEERVRTARNVHSVEGSSGLLGGSATMTETVKIELRSSLGRASEVEVLERVPVTDDKNVTVEALSASPEPVRYDQSERGEPLRGGLRWVVPLAAGGKSEVTLSYRITMPSRSEIVGGNRRG